MLPLGEPLAAGLPPLLGAWCRAVATIHPTLPPPAAPSLHSIPTPPPHPPQEDFGFMSVRAEKTNMRAAMLGLAVLTALEWHSGFCFF